MTDGEIIALYWERDEQAIAVSQEHYGAYCFAIAENILGDREDAEECVNDTWWQAWKAIPPQRPARLKLFLAAVTRHLSLNRYTMIRAKKRGAGEAELILEELEECVAGGTSPEAEVLAGALTESVNAFLKTLSPREGNVFIRRYYFAESLMEISTRYGISQHHGSVMLSRTRQKLRRHLQKEGWI